MRPRQAFAHDRYFRNTIDRFGSEARNFTARPKTLVNELAATGDDAAVIPALKALAAGDLYYPQERWQGVHHRARAQFQPRNLLLIDPVTGDEAGELSKRDLDKVKVNNNLRSTQSTRRWPA